MQNLEITEISINPDLMGLSIKAKNVETNENYVFSANASIIGFARDAFGAILGNIGLNSFMQATQMAALQAQAEGAEGIPAAEAVEGVENEAAPKPADDAR